MRLTNKELFQEAEKWDQKEVVISGWIRNLRDTKGLAFIELNDGTYFKPIQIVVTDAVANFSEITKFHLSSAITVKGTLVLTPQMKQPFEIQAESVELEGASTPDYPLQKKRHSFEYLRTIAHLRPRTNTFLAVFRVRSVLSFAIHQFFYEKGFVLVHTPLITASDAEGAGEMFRVTTLDPLTPPITTEGDVDYKQDFFSKNTNLTVSGQLEGELFAMAFQNIYTFGPTFRAENSNTARHAAEFWMVEPEIAFADLQDNILLAEEMTKYIISFVLKEAPEEMKFFDQFVEKGLIKRLDEVVQSEFKQMTYTQAVEELKLSKRKFEYPVEWGVDLQTEHERYLCEEVIGGPVFITDYPKDIKSFYMRVNEDQKTVAAMDLLVPGVGELIGGSQREERLSVLERRMEEMGVSIEEYEWYLDIRKYGGTKHAGFGLGFERMLMYMTGMSNIRDVIPFPRTVHNCEF